MKHLLAADIGGTNARFAIVEAGPHSLRAAFERTYPTTRFAGFEPALEAFLRDAQAASPPLAQPSRAAIAFAGPVDADGGALTNRPAWRIERKALESLGIAATFLNDFQALAYGVAHAEPRDWLALQPGNPIPHANIALVGDASGSVDAVTGESMALCFRQAAALSVALRANNLALYQQAHRRIQRLPSLMSRSLLLMDRLPALRDTVLRTVHRNPWLFERLLEMHIGYSPLQSFGTEGLHVLTG